MPSLLKNGFYAILICTVLVIISYFFIDKPLALALYRESYSSFSLLKLFTYISNLISIAVAFFYLYYLLRYAYKKTTSLDQVFLAVANSVVITAYIKGVLKFVFGRYWIKTWLFNNPSLIKDHVYGFNFFHASVLNRSFPSGHAAIIAAAMTVLWECYPKHRWLYIILIVLVNVGLVGLDYHFVSDVIAGTFLGAFIGYYVVKISIKGELS